MSPGDIAIDTDHVEWFKGYGPLPVLGPCPHDCIHRVQYQIAWGPDLAHYTLNLCADCYCRAWMPVKRTPGDPARPTTLYGEAKWLQVALPKEADR